MGKSKRQLTHAHASGQLAGYRPIPPSSDVGELESRALQEMACNACGTVGVIYRPYTRWQDGVCVSYRAFAVCPACGAEEEY